MKDYSFNKNFDELNETKKTKFSNIWQSCNYHLGINVQDTEDWSFNKNNILDVQSCGVNFQGYFKEDVKQQNLLDNLYTELLKVSNKK